MRRGLDGGRMVGPGLGRMFPARRFRRGIGYRPLGMQAQRHLMRANQLMLAGEALHAALIFASISLLAQENGMPARSANLAARAAMAYIESGDIAHGAEYALKAARQSASTGDITRAVQIAQQVLNQMRVRGFKADAETLRTQLDGALAPYGISLASSVPAQPVNARKLPTQCPACLGPVRADSAEWIDEHTAECAYCGSILQTE